MMENSNGGYFDIDPSYALARMNGHLPGWPPYYGDFYPYNHHVPIWPSCAKSPWVCPKCGRVYGPDVRQCVACNHRIFEEEQKAGDWETGCTTNVTSDKVKIVTNITSHEED